MSKIKYSIYSLDIRLHQTAAQTQGNCVISLYYDKEKDRRS